MINVEYHLRHYSSTKNCKRYRKIIFLLGFIFRIFNPVFPLYIIFFGAIALTHHHYYVFIAISQSYGVIVVLSKWLMEHLHLFMITINFLLPLNGLIANILHLYLLLMCTIFVLKVLRNLSIPANILEMAHIVYKKSK